MTAHQDDRAPAPGPDRTALEAGGDDIPLRRPRAAARGRRLQYARGADPGPGDAPVRAAASRTGPTPLVTCQSWFFTSGHFDDLNRWNTGGVVELRRRLDPTCLRRAVAAVVARHDVLRARFAPGAGGWAQEIVPCDALAEDGAFRLIEQPGAQEAEQDAIIDAAGARLQSEFELERGLLFRVALFDFGPASPQRLLVLAHHLIVDATSYNVLFEDLERVYLGLLSGRNAPAAEPAAFRPWALEFVQHARELCAAESDYWLRLAAKDHDELPLDAPEARAMNLEASTSSVELDWEPGVLRGLRCGPAHEPWRVPDALLFLFVVTLFEWTRASELLLKVMNSGRFLLPPGSRFDVTRTAGPFAFAGLLEFRALRGRSLTELGADFREQLAHIPGGGTGAEIIAQSSPDPDVAAAIRRLLGRNSVLFNYYIRTDLGASSLAESVRIFRERTRSPGDRRPDVLECTFVESEAGLHAEFGYSRNLHRRETIEQLCAQFCRHLAAFAGLAAARGRTARY